METSRWPTAEPRHISGLDQRSFLHLRQVIGIQVVDDWWPWLQANFPNRQIATGIWFFIGFVLCCLSRNIRSSIGGVLKALVQRKLIILFGWTIFNVGVLCWLLSMIALWARDQLTATVLWTAMSGLALAGRTLSAGNDQGYFKRLSVDCLKITVVLEFLVVGHSFSLPIELALVFVMTVLALLIEVWRAKDELASVRTLFEWIVAGVVAFVLWKALWSIWDRPDAFFTTKTGRNFLLPMLLTVGSIPFLYILHCYANIELARVRIGQKTFQSDELKRYARRRFFLRFMARPRLLLHAARQFHSLPAGTRNDVDQIVADVVVHERLRKNPPNVDGNLGWSPYLACEFLKPEGFETSDYHRGAGGDPWWAESSPVDLDSGVLANTACFYVEGLQERATTLKLRAHFNGASDPASGKARFNQVAEFLLERSIAGDSGHARAAVQSDEDFVLTIRGVRIARETEPYPDQAGFVLSLILSRGNTAV